MLLWLQLTAVRVRTRKDINEKIKLLHEWEMKFVVQAGKLYERMWAMQHAEQISENVCFVTVVALAPLVL